MPEGTSHYRATWAALGRGALLQQQTIGETAGARRRTSAASPRTRGARHMATSSMMRWRVGRPAVLARCKTPDLLCPSSTPGRSRSRGESHHGRRLSESDLELRALPAERRASNAIRRQPPGANHRRIPLLIAGQRSARMDKGGARDRGSPGRRRLPAPALSPPKRVALFVALLAQEKVRVAFSTANEELVRLRDIVAGREVSGVASRYDVTRLEIELGGFRTKLEEAKAEISDRAGILAALLGLQNWRPRARRFPSLGARRRHAQ